MRSEQNRPRALGRRRSAMDREARISHTPVEQAPADEFASPAVARAYIDTARERISAFAVHEVIDVLERLDRAYREFPELALDRPRGELLERLRSAARDMPDRTAIPLLMYCAASDPSCSSSVTSLLEKLARSNDLPSLASVLRLLCRSRRLRWGTIKPIVNFLLQAGRTNTSLHVISQLLDFVKFENKDAASDVGDILICFLSDTHPLGIDSGALAATARSARRRLNQPLLRPNEGGSRRVLLAMAERFLDISSPATPDPHPRPAWPSGRMSFDAFLLQWPCEIELPFDLDDADFIAEAYRAILLRGPAVAESDQYLRLLRNGAVSKIWIVEDLLASEELRSLERRLRVVWGDHVITEPGSSGEEDMAAVTWPWRRPG